MKNISLYAKEIDGQLVFNNKRELSIYLQQNKGKKLRVKLERETGVRTGTQNQALHLWFEMLAQELNESGYTVQLVLKEKIDLDWSLESVKELLWRPAQKALVKKKSTTELDKTSNITTVWEHLNRHLGEKFAIHVPFPDKSQIPKGQIDYPQNNLGEAKF